MIFAFNPPLTGKMNKTTFPKQFPQLETKRLILRAVTPDDKQAVFCNFSDEAVVEHFMEPFTILEQAESIVAYEKENRKNLKHRRRI